MTHYVAGKVKGITETPSVLIIGTQAAKNANFYGKLFEERGVQYFYLTEELQSIAQQEIDRAKTGEIKQSVMYDIICKMVQENPVNVILLGCTELSMVLEGQRKQLDELGVIILNSEEIFAEKICLDIEAYALSISVDK